jgi:hypothetical protein
MKQKSPSTQQSGLEFQKLDLNQQKSNNQKFFVSQVPIQQHKGNSKEPNWGKVQTQHT